MSRETSWTDLLQYSAVVRLPLGGPVSPYHNLFAPLTSGVDVRIMIELYKESPRQQEQPIIIIYFGGGGGR